MRAAMVSGTACRATGPVEPRGQGAVQPAPPVGPVQILVLGFADDPFPGRIRDELRRLSETDEVRLLDLLVVHKDDEGELAVHRVGDLDEDEARAFGALVGALVGLETAGDDERRDAGAGAAASESRQRLDADAWYLSDAIPAGAAAVIALVEHRWAIALRDTIAEAGGFALADEWLHPADLVAVGVAAKRSHPLGA